MFIFSRFSLNICEETAGPLDIVHVYDRDIAWDFPSKISANCGEKSVLKFVITFFIISKTFLSKLSFKKNAGMIDIVFAQRSFQAKRLLFKELITFRCGVLNIMYRWAGILD